jgi:hypothetical protein
VALHALYFALTRIVWTNALQITDQISKAMDLKLPGIIKGLFFTLLMSFLWRKVSWSCI